MLRPCLLLAAIVWPAVSSLAQQFQRDAAALPAQSLWTDGVELVDVEGDGDVDILFANGQGYGAGGQLSQHLFLNDGAGSFSAAHGQLLVSAINAKMVIADDFDGDGDPDLLYAVEGSAAVPTELPRILMNDSSGVFRDETATRLPAIPMASFCVCAGDVDNDGDLDVVLTDGATFSGTASQARLYLNDGTAHFSDATASHLPVDLYNAQDVTLFDYDGDFDIDIALSGKGQAGRRARLYVNDGTGHFAVSTILDGLGTGNTYEIDWGDLDGDGSVDAAVQSVSGVQEGWARNEGVLAVPTKSTFPTPNGQDDNEMACMDYDSDGDLDVFVGSLGPAEKVYTNQGGGSFAKDGTAIQAIADSTLDLGFADLNGDGRYDMVTAQGESGSFTNKVYFNQGPPDGTPPVFLSVETPAAVGDPVTVFRVQVRDAIQDDGHVNARLTYAWTTTGVSAGSGNGAAAPQGGGLFRASIPSGTGTTSVQIDWTATDSSGNSSTTGPVVVGASPWMDLGFALPGAAGEPVLAGTGPLTAGSAASLDLTGAAPGVPCILFVALDSTPVPFLGGTLAAFPVVTQLFLVTLGNGSLPLPFVWPVGIPAGTQLHFQYGIQDAGGAAGAALSNALKAQTP